jgi:hypothetical protein
MLRLLLHINLIFFQSFQLSPLGNTQQKKLVIYNVSLQYMHALFIWKFHHFFQIKNEFF